MIAGLIGRHVSTDRATCGAIIGITFWWISVLALQPVVWANGITMTRRLTCWAVAVSGGFLAAYLLEGLVIYLFKENVGLLAIQIGTIKNVFASAIALLVSLYLVGRATGRDLLSDVVGSRTDSAVETGESGSTSTIENERCETTRFQPWRKRSKLFRLFWFAAGCWAVCVLVIVALFDPYNLGDWHYMDISELLHMLSIMFVIPAIVGCAIYIYQRFVK